MRLWRPFHAPVRVPGAGVGIPETSASTGALGRGRGCRASRASRQRRFCPHSPVLPGPRFYPCPLHPRPSTCQCLQPCHCRQNFEGDSGLSRPRILSSVASRRLGGLPGLSHPIRMLPIILGSPVMSVPGLLGFPSLDQLPKPAMILTTLLEYPELSSVPPPHFVSAPLPVTPSPPQFCQGSLCL